MGVVKMWAASARVTRESASDDRHYPAERVSDVALGPGLVAVSAWDGAEEPRGIPDGWLDLGGREADQGRRYPSRRSWSASGTYRGSVVI